MHFLKNSKHGTLLQIWLTLRIQPFWTFSYDSTNWTFYTTLRIEPFSARLKELNSFQYHSKQWTFFSTWLKELNLIELSLKELNLLFHDFNKLNPFLKRLNELNIFLWSKELYFLCWMWSKELNLFFVECDPKNWIIVENHEQLIFFTKMTENWTLFEPFHMTRRNELFWNDSKN